MSRGERCRVREKRQVAQFFSFVKYLSFFSVLVARKKECMLVSSLYPRADVRFF